MKKIAVSLVVAFLCLSLAAWAQIKSDEIIQTPEPLGGMVVLTDGGVTVTVNSFGRAGHSTPGCAGVGAGFRIDETDSVLCEHTDYLSTGGAVMAVNSPQCTVVTPIAADAPNHATSTVKCGDCTVDFDQTVDDSAKSWTTNVTITGCPAACYFSYTDYDVHGFANNGGSWQASAGGGSLGQFVVRNNVALPNVHYLFTDGSGAVHWEQGEWPSVRDKISRMTRCDNLADAPLVFLNGDWTGALQYSFSSIDPQGGVTVSYSLGRDDTTEFP